MDLLKPRIPATFALRNADLCWRDVRFGIEQELLDPSVARELAMAQLGLHEESPALLELAIAAAHEPLLPLVIPLANAEPLYAEALMREKFLYLVLAWFYAQRDSLSDPLMRVEEAYADFGYPTRIARLVRYMPSDEPSLGDRAANEARLFHRWKEYLDEESQRFAPSTSQLEV